MAISSSLKVLLLLPVLIYAQSCDYSGKTYSHLDTFFHQNGCAKLQCQKGSILPVYEACGRDLDGACHLVRSQFLYNGAYYRCLGRIVKNLPVYYTEPLPLNIPPNCTAEGTVYKSWDKFTRSDGCRIYQCQSGLMPVLSPEACDKKLDGKCNYVNAWVLSNSKVYKCEKQVVSGKPVYSYTLINPQPVQSSTCTANNKRLTFLQKTDNTDNCGISQCQDEKLVPLSEVCRSPQDGKCYPLDSQWKVGDKIYGCVKNTDGSYEIKVIPPSYKSCTLDNKTYDHTQTVTIGCSISQCQSSKFVRIYAACQDGQGICRPLNSIWTEGSNRFQCTEKAGWGLTVDRVIGDEIIPVCANPGKDVIFVIDNSGSIGATNFEKVKTFIARLTLRFFIGTNASKSEFQFGAISFSGAVIKEFDLNTYTDSTQLYNAIQAIPFRAGGTYTDLAFDYIINYNLFSKGRTVAPDIALLITDGISTVPAKTQVSAKRVRDIKVQILALGVGANINTVELNGVTNNSSDVYNIADFASFKQIEDRLSQKVCTA
uniref:VWFA domain-containing protein n=1 Tax=Arion vulgaris TaxID=1028688 RepID=A0A0B7BLF1_9EUPU